MNNQEKIDDPAKHLLIIVLGKIMRTELGGTKDKSESLAIKLIKIMDNEL